MDKNVLITGGAGFIGSNLAIKMRTSGYHITILDNLSKQIHGEYPEATSPLYRSILDKNITVINGSVTSKKDWNAALEGIDIVIHLAAETGTGQSMYEIEKYVNTNVRGTSILLDYLTNNKHNIKKIIVASSRAVYGEGRYKCKEHGYIYPVERKEADLDNGDYNCKCPICNTTVALCSTNEESLIHPSSIYGITKYNQEQMVINVCKALQIPGVALRYQNVYGPGQSLTNPYTGILSIFSTLIRNGRDLNIFEDGKESRDFVYIDDVVNATIKAIESDNVNYGIFNVGSGESVSVLHVAKTLIDKYNSSSKFKITGDYRIGDIRHNFADVTKMHRILGYRASTNFSAGTDKFVTWVKKQDKVKTDYDKSIDEMREKGLLK